MWLKVTCLFVSQPSRYETAINNHTDNNTLRKTWYFIPNLAKGSTSLWFVVCLLVLICEIMVNQITPPL